MKNLVKQVQNNAFRKDLWVKNSKIVLGVSGGPDSVCMLDVFSKLAKKYNLSLFIAHVNYHLRGSASNRDEKFVLKLAKKYKLPIEILNWNDNNMSEDNLRNVRYSFFEKIRKNNIFDLIAVAHNKNDQAETFLMRIIRGSGLSGLSAIKWKNEKIIRPLLGNSREEILDYLKTIKLTYKIDQTNKENTFLRNKIRNKLIPYIENNFNPKIIDTIFSASASIAEDYSFLSELANKAYHKNIKDLSVKKITNLDPSMQKMLIRKIISTHKQDLKNIESKHIEEILKIFNSTKGKKQIISFQGLKLTRNGDKVIISCL